MLKSLKESISYKLTTFTIRKRSKLLYLFVLNSLKKKKNSANQLKVFYLFIYTIHGPLLKHPINFDKLTIIKVFFPQKI